MCIENLHFNCVLISLKENYYFDLMKAILVKMSEGQGELGCLKSMIEGGEYEKYELLNDQMKGDFLQKSNNNKPNKQTNKQKTIKTPTICYSCSK